MEQKSQRLQDRIKQHVPQWLRQQLTRPHLYQPHRSYKRNDTKPDCDSAIAQHFLENDQCALNYDDKRFSILATARSSFHLYLLERGFPTRGARQHLRGCEMVIQIFVLHYCTVMLISSCAHCSAQSVSNYSMPGARSSIQPEMMLISKKKVSTCNFCRNFKIGPYLIPDVL